MKPGVFREEYIAIIIRELLRGLDYLHTEGKLHRDIKGRPITPFRFSKFNIYPLHSGKYPTLCWRGSETCGLWCFGTIVWHFIREEEYFRRDPLLDVSRSYQTEWL